MSQCICYNNYSIKVGLYENYKKLSLVVLSLAMMITIVSCGGKNEEVVYEMNNNGMKIVLTIEYYKDKNIQKTTTVTNIDFEESPEAEEMVRQNLELTDKMYKDTKGLEHTVKEDGKKLTETTVMNIKDMPKESKSILFMGLVDDKDNVSLDKMVKQFESLGYSKK